MNIGKDVVNDDESNFLDDSSNFCMNVAHIKYF